MTVDTVQPASNVQALNPDADGRAGRDPRPEGKLEERPAEPVQPRRRSTDRKIPRGAVVNSLGQITGQTINIAV